MTKTKVSSFKDYLMNTAVKQVGIGHYTPNVANLYAAAVSSVGSRIQRDLWEVEDAEEIRSLLRKVENQNWFVVGDPHKTWRNGILRYSEFLDFYFEKNQIKIEKATENIEPVLKQEIPNEYEENSHEKSLEQEIANQALHTIEHVSVSAETEYRSKLNMSYDTMTSTVHNSVLQALRITVNQPLYASVKVRNCNTKNIETYYITKGYTISNPRFFIENSNCILVNSHTDKATLVSQDIGDFYEVNTPKGSIEYEILQKNSFGTYRENGKWDASAKFYFEKNASSCTSLRILLASDFDSEIFSFSNELIENEPGKIKQDIISNMGLRDNPILDKFQDKIQRADPNSTIVVLGAPGTGKTTTLIKKLGLSLDEDYSKLAGDKSWYMFTPTDLLKSYLKEAFNRENIAAPDQNVFSWKTFIKNIARNDLMLLETPLRSGFQLTEKEYFKIQSSENQKNIFKQFFEFQNHEFLLKLISSYEDIKKLKDADIYEILSYINIDINSRIISVCSDLEKVSDKVSIKLQQLQDQLKNILGKALTSGLKWKKEEVNENLLNLRNKIDSKFKVLLNSVDDNNDENNDEDNKHYATTSQDIVQKYLIEPIQGLSYSFYKKKKVSEKSFNFIAGEYIKFNQIIPDVLKEKIGFLVEEIRLLRNFKNPQNRYLSSLKTRYKLFRSTHKDLYIENFDSKSISYSELDVIILSYLKAYKAFKMDRLDEKIMRRQVFVDEITDFSAVQIAIMYNLLQTNSKSFFGAGDINQRLTEIGITSTNDLKWALPQVEIEEIKIPYRQSKQLFELSVKIIGQELNSYDQPKYIDTDRCNPVIGYFLDDIEKKAVWLADRIIEIERSIKILPSIAILVNTEEKVKQLADVLNQKLENNSITVDACENGRIIGNEHSVRIFCIDYIKGLEFEAAFFMDVDELAEKKPNIFEKYLYVGISRAATFLGLTSRGEKMPEKIEKLRSSFIDDWK